MTLSSLISSLTVIGRSRCSRLLLLLCVLALPCGVRAQDDEKQNQLEESTSTELEKLKPLTDAKNWDGALALLKSIEPKVGPESFDMAMIKDVEAKLYLQKGDYAKVLPPWELALRLHDAHKYFSPQSVQDILYYLAQIYYQEGATTKVPAVQKQQFAKATTYIERWIANTTKPPQDPTRQEAAVFYALVLYNQGVQDPAHIDMSLIDRAEVEVKKGLRMSAHPKDTFYLLLLSIAQQKNDYPKLAEILEYLVKLTPAKKDYWSQLAGVYLNLAQNEKNEQKARDFNTRAILAIERAQALGFMKTPKENFQLVGVYYNVGQFGRATEILHAGLRDGSIESDLSNWALLASSYQQVDQPFKAVEALSEGSKKFPKSGQLDYQAAQIYYSLNKPQEAYDHLQSALSKGNLDKPGAVNGFLGYVCWELGKYTEAVAAIDKALASPDAKKDTQLPKLRQAILDTIREQEAAKADNTTKRL